MSISPRGPIPRNHMPSLSSRPFFFSNLLKRCGALENRGVPQLPIPVLIEWLEAPVSQRPITS